MNNALLPHFFLARARKKRGKHKETKTWKERGFDSPLLSNPHPQTTQRGAAAPLWKLPKGFADAKPRRWLGGTKTSPLRIFSGSGKRGCMYRPCAPVLNGWHLLYKSCFFGDLKPRFFSAQKKWGFRKRVFFIGTRKHVSIRKQQYCEQVSQHCCFSIFFGYWTICR